MECKIEKIVVMLKNGNTIQSTGTRFEDFELFMEKLFKVMKDSEHESLNIENVEQQTDKPYVTDYRNYQGQ